MPQSPAPTGNGNGNGPVVFVCTGNICRSPLAERLATVLDPTTQFRSAGTYAMEGMEMDAGMAQQLERLGGSPAGHRAECMRTAHGWNPRLVLALTREHRDFIVQRCPDLAGGTVVLKPYARLVERGLVQPWDAPSPANAHSTETGTYDDDIADPYRLGWREEKRCADDIDAALRR